MNTNPRNTKRKANWKRRIIWALVALAAFGVSEIIGTNMRTQKQKAEKLTLGPEVAKIWMGECSEIDMLNILARKKTREEGLKPGDPLPPNQLGANIPWANKPEAARIFKVFNPKGKYVTTNFFIFAGTRGVVPNPREAYAAVALLGNKDICPTGIRIHPKNKGAWEIIQDFYRSWEKNGAQPAPEP
jgi:hypothetical protein